MKPMILLHLAGTSSVASDCEIWVNPAHVVSIEPHIVPGEDSGATVQLPGFRFNTVESYDWVIEQFTGRGLDGAFGRSTPTETS